MFHNLLHLHLVVFDIVILWARAELFTATSEMEPLLDTHRRLVVDLEYFIQKEEKRLHILDKYLNIYKLEHWKATGDRSSYVGKPLNAFNLIKRLTTDLDNIVESVNVTAEYEKNITLLHADVKYPTAIDLTGAAQALVRLQDVYNLSVADISEGILNGVVHSTPMAASDCYELGRSLYTKKDFKNSLAWMQQALRKLKKTSDPRRVREADVLEYIGFLYYLLDDPKNALKWTNKLLEVAPLHQGAPGNIMQYEKMISEEKKRLKKEPVQMNDEYEADRIYKSLCRGDIEIPAKVSKRLYCRYERDNHPFLRLAPIKMEELYQRPPVVLFHEVISNTEIRLIKELAKVNFVRGMVQNPTTGDLEPAPYRISKSGWVSDEDSPIMARVSRRVSDMTGLSILTAEDMEVVNYGLAGQYEPHFDFFLKNSSVVLTNGTRIASVLFYMSDVEQGGATVFPELGLSVSPVKGAALFWLNLHPSGEGDFATLHGGCPVIRGSKWVGLKWIHQVGQELLRPCTLQYQPEGILRKFPRPVPRTAR